MIKNFTIYGERCSGTNFLEALFTGKSFFYDDSKLDLDPKFKKQSKAAFNLPITWDFGHKHFFGFKDKEILEHGNETLFLGIVRDPFRWLSSLFVERHHVPQCNWSYDKFLFGEWYSIDHDRFSEKFLQEELEDRNFNTGKRYKNIFELRKSKLEYLYDKMPKLAKHYMLIRYEDLCNNQENIVNAISSRFGLEIINNNYVKPKVQKPHEVLNDYNQLIEDNLQWKIEGCIGYRKKPKDIIEFYESHSIPPEFDVEFYKKANPETKDFYQPICKNLGINDAHRLFYHYSLYGVHENRKINISGLPSNNIDLLGISNGNMEDIVPVNKNFIDRYQKKVAIGKEIAKQSKIVFVSLARNCEEQISDSINTAMSVEAKKLNLFVYENDSFDQTKDILKSYVRGQDIELYHNLEAPEITVVCNDLNIEDVRDRSLIRTHRLADYRNRCVDWVKDNHDDADYVIVLDLDADLGFSADGIYNSISWLNLIETAGGMGSYSLLLNNHNCVHYDSFAVRLNDWLPSEEKDPNNKWFRNFHPPVGSDPIPFYSCFGGLAVYKAKAFLSGKYGGDLGSEHVEFHKSMKENGWDMYLNPSSRFFSVFEV